MLLVQLNVNGKEDTLILGPHETSVTTHHANKDVPLEVTTNYQGPKDAIRSFGYIASEISGSLPIRFYDVAASTQRRLTAPGVLTNAMKTLAFVRNVSNSPVVVVPHVVEAGAESPKRVDGPSVTIGPNSSVQLDLQVIFKDLGQLGISRATVSIDSSAPAGSMVASLTQIISPKLIEDIPFRTGNSERFMRGGVSAPLDEGL
jgi:hypothetical protein